MAGGRLSAGTGPPLADGVVSPCRIGAAVGAAGRGDARDRSTIPDARHSRRRPSANGRARRRTSERRSRALQPVSTPRCRSAWRRLPLEHQLLRSDARTVDAGRFAGDQQVFAWRLGENHRAELLRYMLFRSWVHAGSNCSRLPRMGAGDPRAHRAEHAGQGAKGRGRLSTGSRVAVARRACHEQCLGHSRIANRVGTADSRQRSASGHRDAVGVVGSACRVGHVECDRRHHTGHSVRRHRSQRADRLGADERRRRRSGFFCRAARCRRDSAIASATSGCRSRSGATRFASAAVMSLSSSRCDRRGTAPS